MSNATAPFAESRIEETNVSSVTEAIKKAREVLAEVGVTQPPVNPITIAKRLGYSVNAAIFEPSTTSGRAQKHNGSVRIDVNASDHPNRRRFTLAHEIGHVLLHLNGIEDAVISDPEWRRATSELRPAKEVEADSFAAALLMPEEWVIERYKADKNVDTLADYFGVSREAMKIQLEKLHLG